MDWLLIVLRIIHVVGGVFWVGSMVFVANFLMPAVGDVGPDGGKVIAALARRNFMNIVPLVAFVTIAAGFWLYLSAGAGSSSYFASGPAKVYGVGAMCALAAFFIGMTITRPAMLNGIKLSQAATGAALPERDELMAKAMALRVRGAKAGKVIAVLLLLSALSMAVGRYV